MDCRKQPNSSIIFLEWLLYRKSLVIWQVKYVCSEFIIFWSVSRRVFFQMQTNAVESANLKLNVLHLVNFVFVTISYGFAVTSYFTLYPHLLLFRRSFWQIVSVASTLYQRACYIYSFIFSSTTLESIFTVQDSICVPMYKAVTACHHACTGCDVEDKWWFFHFI